MKKKGFTLVELLVVIAIIAMLLAILMPALAKVRTLAQRLMCGTNVGGIGKAMMTYASDDKYESYPVAGPGSTIQDLGASANAECSWHWNCKDSPGSTSIQNATPYTSTISACLYLLIKFADVPPEQFLCPGGEEKKFELVNYKTDTYPGISSFTDVWDFGSWKDTQTNYSRKWGHNSYSYQQPLPLSTTQTPYTKPHPISATSAPVCIVLADRSPYWMDDTYHTQIVNNMNDTTTAPIWDTVKNEISKDYGYRANSFQHNQDGQNVLYADQHVKFEKLFNAGVDKDNIYTTWNYASSDTAFSTKSTTDQAKIKQMHGGIAPSRTMDVGNFSQDDADTYLIQDFITKQ
ncbi:MAG: type II secretion system protein [Sedimentisphaerales bacterium]